MAYHNHTKGAALADNNKIVTVVCRVNVCTLSVLGFSRYTNLQTALSEYDDTALSILEEHNESY